MKAISIRQPWAWRIIHEGKDIENRDWRTHFRGPVLIHASKGFDSSDRQEVRAKDMPVGGIVGMAEIIDCVTQSASPWFFGHYGFVLADVRPLPFIACKGALSLFKPDIAENGCYHLGAFRLKLRGLGVTSVKWKCAARVDRFQPGQLVWVDTIESRNPERMGDDGMPYRGEFPGIFIRQIGSKGIVFIAVDAVSACETMRFDGQRFCKISLKHLHPRGVPGGTDPICKVCQYPESAGHDAGSPCHPNYMSQVFSFEPSSDEVTK